MTSSTGRIDRHPLLASPLEAADGHHGYSSPRGDGADNLVVAAPLSHGSNPNSNMAGRRREDDYNLVASPVTSKWAKGSGGPAGDETQNLVPVALNLRGREHGANPELDDLASLRAASGGSSRSYVAGASVRRLTPTECERLQALPDGWTDFGPDSRRYAALGDAVTASVAEFLGRRLIRAETST